MERREGVRGTQKCAEAVVQIYASLLISRPSDVGFRPHHARMRDAFIHPLLSMYRCILDNESCCTV